MFPAYGFGGGVAATRWSEREARRLDPARSVLRDLHRGFQFLLDEPAALGVGAVGEQAWAWPNAGREVERGLMLVEATGGLVPGACRRAR